MRLLVLENTHIMGDSTVELGTLRHRIWTLSAAPYPIEETEHKNEIKIFAVS